MDEQTLQMLIELGALGDEDQDLAQQLEFARALRLNEPELKGTHAGRAFVANNPLQHMAAVLDRQRNNRDMRDIMESRKGIRKKQTAGRGAYGKELFRTPGINPQADMGLYGNDPYQDFGVM